MWITLDGATTELRSEHTNGQLITFTKNGKAQVTDEIGQQMIDNYDNVTASDSN